MVWVDLRPPVHRLSTVRQEKLPPDTAIAPTGVRGTIKIEHEFLRLAIDPGSAADRRVRGGAPLLGPPGWGLPPGYSTAIISG